MSFSGITIDGSFILNNLQNHSAFSNHSKTDEPVGEPSNSRISFRLNLSIAKNAKIACAW